MLFVEKYRPKTIDGFVWASPNLKNKVEEWVSNKEVPNVLFTGGAGRGKTTLARMLMIELGIPTCDILDINASLERKVDALTETITNFTSTWAMGDTGIKYVILDEADRLSPLSQDFLRGEIERHHETCRFILTGNDRKKFSEPLHSRFQEFVFSALDRDEAVMRAANILIAEGIKFEPEGLIQYVDAYHPDLRKCINVLQQRSSNGVLQPFVSSDVEATDYLIEMLACLVSGDSKQARQIVRDKVNPDDYISVFRFMFNNIDIFNSDMKQDHVLIAIRDGMWRHATIADAEINMAATLAEIAKIARSK